MEGQSLATGADRLITLGVDRGSGAGFSVYHFLDSFGFVEVPTHPAIEAALEPGRNARTRGPGELFAWLQDPRQARMLRAQTLKALRWYRVTARSRGLVPKPTEDVTWARLRLCRAEERRRLASTAKQEAA